MNRQCENKKIRKTENGLCPEAAETGEFIYNVSVCHKRYTARFIKVQTRNLPDDLSMGRFRK